MNKVYELLLCTLLFFFHITPAQAEKILDIQELKTKDGINIWLVEDHSVPVVSMHFGFAGGIGLDPVDKGGLAYITSALLDEGAGEMTSQDFQTALADHSISMRFTAGRDHFTGHIKTLKRHSDKAATLLNLALTQPRFDDEAITRIKQNSVANTKHNLKTPSWLVARSFNGALFKNSAYANPGQGTLKSVESITVEDIKSFSKQQFITKTLKVSLAGDITPDDAITLVETSFANLPKGSKNSKTKIKLHDTGQTILYPYDNPQTHIIAGHIGIKSDDPDWAAAQILNYSLGGGGFDSRLMKELREARGLTYGVSTSLANLDRAPMIQTRFSTSNENTAEAIMLLKQEWQKMALTGPTEEELQHAKNYLIGAFPLALTSTSAISSLMNSVQNRGLNTSYINERNKRIADVSLDDARRAAGRLLKPDQLTIMMVGAPTGIEPDETLDIILGFEDQ